MTQAIVLKPATREDMETVWKMQIEAFDELLQKYQDYDLSPATESLERIIQKSEHPWSTYFFIMVEYEKLGYHQTGRIENINERMDIVFYEKN